MSVTKHYSAYFNYGKLYIITKGKIVSINPSKASVRMRDKNRDVWHGCRHLYIDLFPERYVKFWDEKRAIANIPKNVSIKKFSALSNFYNMLDRDVVLFLREIPHTQWQVLRNILRYGSRVKKFIFENPALSYMVLTYCHKKIDFSKVIQRKRRKILSLIGMPEEEKFVKILSKISPENLFGTLCSMILQLFQGELMDKDKLTILTHIRSINPPVIFALNSTVYNVLNRNFLLQLGEIQDRKILKKIYFALSNIEIALREANAGTIEYTPARVRTLQQLFTEEERALGIDIAPSITEHKNLKFPAPPFKGDEHITPIEDYDTLLIESETMQHCIRNFGDSIAKGKYYAYRVNFKSKNYSFMIEKINGTWKLYDIRGRRNSTPPKQVREIVFKWCDINNINICKDMNNENFDFFL